MEMCFRPTALGLQHQSFPSRPFFSVFPAHHPTLDSYFCSYTPVTVGFSLVYADHSSVLYDLTIVFIEVCWMLRRLRTSKTSVLCFSIHLLDTSYSAFIVLFIRVKTNVTVFSFKCLLVSFLLLSVSHFCN